MMGIFSSLFGAKRDIKKIQPTVDKILALEEEYGALSEEELKGKTQLFKDRLQSGETLDDILPEAFATLREAAWRVLGEKAYPVQLIGGIVLHQGRIAEMKTGEGKTLVATLPCYLNALNGKGVHVITVNDYLAKRDSEWMGKVYKYLGLSVGLVIHGMNHEQKQAAYNADITYGTNNEFGFDYLRDNMVIYKDQMVQRGHAFAIVDEVDSILIDEARTPLIISGQADKPNELYAMADRFVKGLKSVMVTEMDNKESNDGRTEDYIIDEKAKTAILLKNGVKKAEAYFGVACLSDAENSELSHHINQALKANGIMKRDVDYVVKDGEVIIVDEFTGRLMFGRRYSQGLHQAIEAKEHVKVENESKTLATITFQNYFRLYKKLSGMTGTAKTEEDEFTEIYNLDVVEIPTNRPVARIDNEDVIYKTVAAKYNAICDQIVECNKRGQPVLVGTVSIERSEDISKTLRKRGIKHEVLNAKHHEKEAEIVAQAGKKGAVTIATNMAGRGTDIKLGGNAEFMAKSEMKRQGFSDELIIESTGHAETDNEDIIKAREYFAEAEARYKKQIEIEANEVREAGGLFVLGTERHESRRIDNQLRGRSGRQGDPGESRFYLSMEDDLMRLFGGERVYNMMSMLNIPEDQPLEMKMLSSTIESAQKRVEGMNFARRKSVLDYDDVMNKQREVIYAQRRQVLDGEDVKKSVMKMLDEVIENTVSQFTNDVKDSWNLDAVRAAFAGVFLTENDLRYDKKTFERIDREDIIAELKEKAYARYAEREEMNTPEIMREIERIVLLQVVDRHWMNHIDAMDDLREGIRLRAYAQRDPIVEYRYESADMFDAMIAEIKEETVRLAMTAVIRRNDELKRKEVAKASDASLAGGTGAQKKKSAVISKNGPCPCGSGKKYKRCCGKDE
ncbi:MAG: preprotein translocase subunit SecA [Clostridia bacterium]|nr:preprotein translocase subunit SecA [Clostridia bacterium]